MESCDVLNGVCQSSQTWSDFVRVHPTRQGLDLPTYCDLLARQSSVSNHDWEVCFFRVQVVGVSVSGDDVAGRGKNTAQRTHRKATERPQKGHPSKPTSSRDLDTTHHCSFCTTVLARATLKPCDYDLLDLR